MAGATQTDTVTVIAVDNDGTTVTASDDATVTLTAAPSIRVDKTAEPVHPARAGRHLHLHGSWSPTPAPSR